MKTLTVSCLLLLALPGAASAQSDEVAPGRDLAHLIYGSNEDSPERAADIGVFTEWDLGFNFIAEGEGRQSACQTAQKVVFAFWSRHANGENSLTEYHKSMVADFRRADTSDDALLTRDAFHNGYVINIAYRAAITGQ